MTGKSDTTNTSKQKRRTIRVEHIPFVREVPVVASATMVALRYVGAWLRAGDQERGGFLVRLGALGLGGYIALYFTEKHPGLWYVYGAAGLVVVTTVAISHRSVGRPHGEGPGSRTRHCRGGRAAGERHQERS
ncbi:hypothetical protein PZB75_31925 (plasmid) [Streptomyces sp. AM 4-1-1]|uniref:hypothetical protein n=1 Tax=Streptomyces sp. AM 4-1-1 TaxID=3028710 RepID=UPI0023BA3BB8|nr:hypothetical protein [Streptomyces sp. AM 4-1-1]WEH38007.1 hypothetical protein PZB75_31925 [Streptomyces sp. AM 4-1-1]